MVGRYFIIWGKYKLVTYDHFSQMIVYDLCVSLGYGHLPVTVESEG